MIGWALPRMTSRCMAVNGICSQSSKIFSESRIYLSSYHFLPHHAKNHLFGERDSASEDHLFPQSDPKNKNLNIDFVSLPALAGPDIVSHVNEISERQIFEYRKLLNDLVATRHPAIPTKWIMQSGWTCYREGFDPKIVDFPDEDVLCFDAEVCVPESFAPVLATAVSSTAWYCWVSPKLMNLTKPKNKFTCMKELIPLGHQSTRPRIVVGHFVCYDAARIKESYNLPLSGLKYFDTMAAHISISGITDLQRYVLLRSTTKPAWASLGSGNSLSELHRLYCGKSLDKSGRNIFVKGSLHDIVESFQELCTYCAHDVEATHSVFSQLFPLFLERFPHAATLSAVLEMSCMIVPVNGDLKDMVKNAKETSALEDKESKEILQDLAEDSLNLINNEDYKKDPWMWDQDWSVSYRKKNSLDSTSYSNKLVKKPEWYRKLASQVSDESLKESGIPVSFRMNIAAKLMQLCWGSYPLHYECSRGWGMLIPAYKASDVTQSTVPVESIQKLCQSFSKKPRVSSVPSWSDYAALQYGITSSNSGISRGTFGFKNDPEERQSEFFMQNGVLFKKLPHTLSIERNVGDVLSMHLLRNESLRSGNRKAQRILKLLRKNLFWKKYGSDFESLPVVWFEENCEKGAVVPSVMTCCDFTRMPREDLFTSLSLENRCSLGVELSKVIEAQDGWCFLSAHLPDADMWIASLLSDSKDGKCCSSRLGKMFAEGSVYSDISHQFKFTTLQSEWLIYAVLWGANKRFLAKAIREVNPLTSLEIAYGRANKLQEYAFGSSNTDESDTFMERGGLLSDFQQKFKELHASEIIATPFLSCRLSRVFESDRKKFSALIQNWLIRSSVTDYLHVLITCFKDFVPTARLCTVSSFKVHIKFLVPEDEKLFAANALHIAHLYATAFCAARVGLSDVPKKAAELPYVTLSSGFREDMSNETQKLTFSEACQSQNAKFLDRNSPKH